MLRSFDLTRYDGAPFAPNIIVVAELPEAESCDVDITSRRLDRGRAEVFMGRLSQIQFITFNSVAFDGGPKWPDQLNRSNEAAKTTPQNTMTASVSSSIGDREVLGSVLVEETIYDLQIRFAKDQYG